MPKKWVTYRWEAITGDTKTGDDSDIDVEQWLRAWGEGVLAVRRALSTLKCGSGLLPGREITT